MRSVEAPPGNLPSEPSPFVGRGGELAAVEALVESARLVTLTGTGGSGKTRLALRVAARRVREHAAGTWFVDLSTVRDDSAVASAIATVLGVEAHIRSALDVLCGLLAASDALLVLDNCEQVVDDAARVCQRLAQSAPSLRLIATSRERLGVPAETLYVVPPLAVPPVSAGPAEVVEFDSVRLFLERAARVRPRFTPSPDDASHIADICRAVDGLPLAVELAAACMRVLSPGRIAEGVSERLRLLGDGSRTAPPRQRSLRASVDWSFGLLSGAERTVFRRLAVFADPFELSTAEAVCAGGAIDRRDVLPLLSQLVDKSLVVADPSRDRYFLLATLREYAGERLEESSELDATLDRHRNAFADLVDAVYPVAWRDEETAVRTLVPVVDDLLAAFDRSDADDMCRLCPSLMPVLRRLHRTETMRVAEQTLAALPSASPLRRAHLVAAWAPWWAGWHPPVPLEVATEAAEVLQAGRDSRAHALALVAAVKSGGPRELAEGAVALSRSLREPVVLATALWSLGTFDELTDGDAALAQAREAVDTASSESLAFGNAARWNLLKLLDRQGRHRDAFGEVRAFLDGPGAGGSFRWRADAHKSIAEANLGRADRVAGHAQQVLQMQRNRTTPASMRPDLLDCLVWLTVGIARHLEGDLEGARSRYEDALAGLAPGPEADYGHHVVGRWLFWCLLGLEDLDSASCVASAITERPFGGPAELDLTPLVRAVGARSAGDARAADAFAHELLPVAAQARRHELVVTCLELVAGKDARLLGAAHALRESTGGLLRLPPFDVWHAADVTAARQEPEFEERWREGASFGVDGAVEYARRGRGTRGRPSVGWASLTPAELSVVEFVAAGLSNQEVAERLFLSSRTVASHLRRVFSKLGVKSRTELARMALSRRA